MLAIGENGASVYTWQVPSRSQRVLLTGGAGFIGSHVVEALLRRGTSLTVVDNLGDFYAPAVKRANLEEVRRTEEFEFLEKDICDFEAVREVFRRFHPQAVIHLAARAGVRASIEQPWLYERVNLGGTVNLLEAAREFGVRKFVFGSSSSVYGAASPRAVFGRATGFTADLAVCRDQARGRDALSHLFPPVRSAKTRAGQEATTSRAGRRRGCTKRRETSAA